MVIQSGSHVFWVCLLIGGFLTVTPSVGQDSNAPAVQQPQPDAPTPPVPTAESDHQATPKGPLATGIVFEDRNNDGEFNEGDSVFVGAKISNGVDIVKTDKDGRYELSIAEDQIIFLLKPSGFRTALDENNLPKFYYIHKPKGSPQLRFAGSKPTGKLPRSIDFPLYRQSEPDQFKMILFGDPQPRNMKEVDYITQDIVSDVIGTDAAFGVSLGDLAFDNLNTLLPLSQSIALIGIPWYNVIGNHDINLDAKSRKYVNETFESIYGPTFYSFDHGQVHFVVMDNIDWKLVEGRQRYVNRFGKRQLEWLKKDLEMIPESQLVVMMMHCPLPYSKDLQSVFRLIENRPLCVSISAHQHYHQHLFLGEDTGWKGKEPHHHIINVTISGSWWGGMKDERGIPHTMMADGAPNGYSIMTFDEDGYKMDFKAANRPASEQIKIIAPMVVSADKAVETKVYVNVYNGSQKSTVRMTVGDSEDWQELDKTVVPDPNFVEIHRRESQLNPPPEPKLPKPKVSSHLWVASLPAGLAPGAHKIRVETTDRHGRVYRGEKLIRVAD